MRLFTRIVSIVISASLIATSPGPLAVSAWAQSKTSGAMVTDLRLGPPGMNEANPVMVPANGALAKYTWLLISPIDRSVMGIRSDGRRVTILSHEQMRKLLTHNGTLHPSIARALPGLFKDAPAENSVGISGELAHSEKTTAEVATLLQQGSISRETLQAKGYTVFEVAPGIATGEDGVIILTQNSAPAALQRRVALRRPKFSALFGNRQNFLSPSGRGSIATITNPAVSDAAAGEGGTSLPAALGGYIPPGVPGAHRHSWYNPTVLNDLAAPFVALGTIMIAAAGSASYSALLLLLFGTAVTATTFLQLNQSKKTESQLQKLLNVRKGQAPLEAIRVEEVNDILRQYSPIKGAQWLFPEKISKRLPPTEGTKDYNFARRVTAPKDTGPSSWKVVTERQSGQKSGWWTTTRAIVGFSAMVALSGLILALFTGHWNLLGWSLGLASVGGIIASLTDSVLQLFDPRLAGQKSLALTRVASLGAMLAGIVLLFFRPTFLVGILSLAAGLSVLIASHAALDKAIQFGAYDPQFISRIEENVSDKNILSNFEIWWDEISGHAKRILKAIRSGSFKQIWLDEAGFTSLSSRFALSDPEIRFARYRRNRRLATYGAFSLPILGFLISGLIPAHSKPKPQITITMVEKYDFKLAGNTPIKHPKKKNQGGGGGGDRSPTPPSPGKAPKFSLDPQLSRPRVNPQKAKMNVDPTLIGNPNITINFPAPVWGVPNAPPAPPSNGPGGGSGIGTGSGGGIGSGTGGGLGPGNGGNMGDGDFALGDDVSAPECISCTKPQYSEEGRKSKIQGEVTLDVIVTENGTIDPNSIKVLHGLGNGLDEKAVETVKTWRLKPAKHHGKPVRYHTPVVIGFRLY